MICTEENVVKELMKLDYTEQEAKSTLARYYHLYMEGSENNIDAELCASDICTAHGEDLDKE